tara:strand:- start:4850 stop:5815 length:966 start_codon:yes stop_codon:yes gene_type:complete
MKTALITGVGGQDGRLLSSLLASKSYEVIGTTRDINRLKGDRHFSELGTKLIQLDLSDSTAISMAIRDHKPDELYNLAAFAVGSNVWNNPESLVDINGIAVLRLLESIRSYSPRSRFCQASSSELFGACQTTPQSERTPMAPRNPYGAAKLYAHHLIKIYREHYGLHASSAIFFNHESSLRSTDFVSRKITRQVARVSLGLADSIELGDLEARRDWGYAGDYMEAAWKMLQCDTADDYVIATGVSHSVRDLCEIACAHVGLDYRTFVRSSEELVRIENPSLLVGDTSHIHARLGWKPRVNFADMVRQMVDHDIKELKLNKR